MDTQPVVFLKGKRLYLRPLALHDAEQCTIWINDPDVRTFIASYLPQSLEEEQSWITGMSAKKQTDITLAIVLDDGNQHIGNIGLHRIDYRAGIAYTGTLIGRKNLWGLGYGSEAKMVLLHYAFNTLMLRKICTSVYAFNERSLRCQLKCGYREEGRLKAQRPHNGGYVTEILLAVFRDEFMPLWQKFEAEMKALEANASTAPCTC